MARRSPIILLIEHDDIDRTILFRMLADHGYRIMAASRGADALDTFVFHHTQIALVLANARMPDIGSAQLARALYLIDPHVPLITARHPDHRLDSSDAERSLAFVELIAEVDRRVFPSFAARQAVLSWPLRDEELDQLEGIEDSTANDWPDSDARLNHGSRESWRDSWRNRDDLLEPVAPPSDALKPVAHRDVRNYLASQSSARRRRRRRIGRAAALIVILTTLAITLMLQFQQTRARANEPEPVEAPASGSSSLLPIDKSLRPSGLHELDRGVFPISAWSWICSVG